jgi:hypothetical protein
MLRGVSVVVATLVLACGGEPPPAPPDSVTLHFGVRNPHEARRDCRIGYNIGVVGGVEDAGTIIEIGEASRGEVLDHAIVIPYGEMVTLMAECSAPGYPEVPGHAVTWMATDPLTDDATCIATYSERTGTSGRVIASMSIQCD